MQAQDRELGWDDTIQNDGEEFVLIPDGIYAYRITKMERGRLAGSTKLPPCNQASVFIEVSTDIGHKTIEDKLKLHSQMEWLLCAFFRSIGLRKEGEKLQMRWNEVVGKRGWVEIETRSYLTKNGEERQINSVKRWLPPEEAPEPPVLPPEPPPAQATFTPGQF